VASNTRTGTKWQRGRGTSVGSRGDAYDNAMAVSVIGLCKAQVIRRQGPRKGLEEVESATLEWGRLVNNTRLLEPIGYVPPAEFEEAFYAQAAATEAEEALKQMSLHRTRGGSAQPLRPAPARACRHAPARQQGARQSRVALRF
jgi:putative transposase